MTESGSSESRPGEAQARGASPHPTTGAPAKKLIPSHDSMPSSKEGKRKSQNNSRSKSQGKDTSSSANENTMTENADGVPKASRYPGSYTSKATQSVNQVLKESGETRPHISSIVEAAANVGKKDHETFVTQRGGKIVQGILPLMNESSSLFEKRRELQSTLLLQKKKEMQTVQALLEKKRLEFSKRMDECKEKQEELRTKQKQIRDRVAKFEKFLKENDAKRQRANAKAAAEKKLREQKEIELHQLQKQLQEEQKKSHRILRQIERHRIFERYLQSIVDILPPDYLDVNEPHINDIIMRHKTLRETNDDLLAVVQQNSEEIENSQAKLTSLIKEKNDLILVYNSKLGTQQKYLEQLKQDCAYLEQRIEERDNTGKERMRLLGEARLAIDNLYDRIAIRPKVKVEAEKTLDNSLSQSQTQLNDLKVRDQKTMAEKLHAIQYRVLDLQDISTMV